MPDGGWVAVHEDITERRRAEAKIAHLARHDMLTNLPNRVLFREHLENAFRGAQPGRGCAVHCLDLDHFKTVNDTLGHPIGDELLKIVASRLVEALPATDFVARIGGDEFAIVQTGCGAARAVQPACRRASSSWSASPTISTAGTSSSATSIGIAIAPNDGANPDQLLKNADMALYLAKGDGRGVHRFFEREMDKRLQARRALELDLRKALANGEFELYYQPIMTLRDRARSSGFEALDALEPSRARADFAGSIHSARGRDRADPAARRVGAAHRVLARRRNGRSPSASPSICRPCSSRAAISCS